MNMAIFALDDLVIKLHSAARELNDPRAEAKIRALADLLSDVAKETKLRWVSTGGSAQSS